MAYSVEKQSAFEIEGGGEPLYFFYDCETTGLKIGYDGIIEIAAVVYTKGLKHIVRQKEFQSLCSTYRQISPKSQEMTGLTNDDLKGKPSLTKVLTNFFNWIEDTVRTASAKDGKRFVPVLAAHSGTKLDFPMLFKAVERIEALQDQFTSLNLHYADTFNVFKSLQSSEEHGPQLQKLGAHDIYLSYFPPLAGAHRALQDARDLCKIFSDAPPAKVFIDKLKTYIQSKDGFTFTREQVRKFLQIKGEDGSTNFFKAYEAVELLHDGIIFEDLEEKFGESEKCFRRFLAQTCGFSREAVDDLVEGFKRLEM